MGDLILPPPAVVAVEAGEGHIVILPYDYESIGQGVWEMVIDYNQFLCGFWQNASNADLDNISYKVYLDKGTYTLGILGVVDTNKGILDIDIDGVEVASFDQYATSKMYNQWFSKTGISIPSSGLKTLRCRIDGKNPSSIGYTTAMSYIVLWRTG